MANPETGLQLWICDTCYASVFMPKRHAGKVLSGGACTQRKRGCAGNLRKASAAEQAAALALVENRGMRLQPWLTLIWPADALPGKDGGTDAEA